jgi:hypothetical protein
MMGKRISGRRRFDPPAAALEQRVSNHLFHATEARTCGRQRQIRLRRAMGDASRLDDEQKQTKVNEVEAHG